MTVAIEFTARGKVGTGLWHPALRTTATAALGGQLFDLATHPAGIAVGFRFTVKRPRDHFDQWGTLRPDAPLRPAKEALDAWTSLAIAALSGAAWRHPNVIGALSAVRCWGDEDQTEVGIMPMTVDPLEAAQVAIDAMGDVVAAAAQLVLKEAS